MGDGDSDVCLGTTTVRVRIPSRPKFFGMDFSSFFSIWLLFWKPPTGSIGTNIFFVEEFFSEFTTNWTFLTLLTIFGEISICYEEFRNWANFLIFKNKGCCFWPFSRLFPYDVKRFGWKLTELIQTNNIRMFLRFFAEKILQKRGSNRISSV